MNQSIFGLEWVRSIFVLSRPRFWLYLAGPILIGLAYGATTVTDLRSIPALVLVAYFILPANIYLYGVNDIYDSAIDHLNPKKSGRERRWSADPRNSGIVLGAGLLGVVPILVTPRMAWAYLAGFFVLALAYSAPPVRFKSTPFLDSLSNGLYILPGAAAYVTLAETHPPTAILLGAWIWCMGMHTFSAIPDIVPDRLAGIRTTATALGKTKTLGYCLVCWSLTAVTFGIVDWRAGLLLTVYPLITVVIAWRSVSVTRAYWWFPAINGFVGAVLTIGGLWHLAGATELLT